MLTNNIGYRRLSEARRDEGNEGLLTQTGDVLTSTPACISLYIPLPFLKSPGFLLQGSDLHCLLVSIAWQITPFNM